MHTKLIKSLTRQRNAMVKNARELSEVDGFETHSAQLRGASELILTWVVELESRGIK
ncbi:MAG: hypothetical protein JKY22_12315 [Flavobacteriaceae bacterium]|nr:hypothetical protein [Flavobacteriaceae bacterium]